jgi:hypothetical protein
MPGFRTPRRRSFRAGIPAGFLAQAFEAPREKVFGLAKGFPHDHNARVRIEAYVMAWNAKNKQEGQRRSPPPTRGAYTRFFCGIS